MTERQLLLQTRVTATIKAYAPFFKLQIIIVSGDQLYTISFVFQVFLENSNHERALHLHHSLPFVSFIKVDS